MLPDIPYSRSLALLPQWVAVIAALILPVAGTCAQPTSGPVILPPVKAACVSSPFGPRTLPGKPLAGTYHYGIDLPAPIGAAVMAVGPGEVLRVQRRGVGGLEILIQHDGFVGIYSHLGLVAPQIAQGGRNIYGGETIATVGRTGLTYGPHLYFGMISNGRAIDPSPFLRIFPCNSRTVAFGETKIQPTRLFAGH